MIKFIFNLILIIGIFSVNSAYSKELVLLCTEKEKKIGEDECKNSEKKIQVLTDKQILELEKRLKEKEKEIMTIWIN